MMTNRNERMYASKFDYLMDINETSDIISDHDEFQTILFMATILFVIMLTVCHFGNIVGLNSHFQKMLATVNKITASINTLLPIFLPASSQATTITHGDSKLHVNYYHLLMYMIQIIAIMVVFSVIVICIQIWNCIDTKNLGKLHEKLNFMQFLCADKTELYFQFISNYKTLSIYLGSFYDNPEGINVTGQFMNGDVTLFEKCVFDFLTIQWDNVNLSQHDLDLWLSSSLPVSLTSKFFLRKIFRKPSILLRIIAFSPQNVKVRLLTSLHKLLPNDDTEEVVSTDTRTYQFEITFFSTVSVEQDLYEQCYNKNKECVTLMMICLS